MKRLFFLAFLLAACAPALLGVDPARLPDPGDWDPKPAQLEWWYASGWAYPYAFHFAFFKAYAPPSYRVLGLPGSLFGAFHAAHLALTDLRTGERRFLEASDQDLLGPRGRAEPGPRLEVSGFRFLGKGTGFRLLAQGVDLLFLPLKPPVVHPPGYSGTEETGRMYYQSYTRARAQGRVLGGGVRGGGLAGPPVGRAAFRGFRHLGLVRPPPLRWLRAHGLPGEGPEGRVVQVLGSRVDPLGRVEAVELAFVPSRPGPAPRGARTPSLGGLRARSWTSGSGPSSRRGRSSPGPPGWPTGRARWWGRGLSGAIPSRPGAWGSLWPGPSAPSLAGAKLKAV
jgi:hypothetical protein